MANAKVFKGGTPNVRFPFCDAASTWDAPHQTLPYEGTPPYNGHVDGAINLGNFALGFPLNWQDNVRLRDIVSQANPQVGEHIELITIPEYTQMDSFVFDVVGTDEALDGFVVEFSAILGTMEVDDDGNLTGDWTEAEITDITDAAAAQGVTNVPMHEPGSYRVSMLTATTSGGAPSVTLDVTGTATGPITVDPDTGAGNASLTVTGTATGSTSGGGGGYVDSFYVAPNTFVRVTLKIVSLPTDTDVNIWDALNYQYFTSRLQAYDCPAWV